MYPHLDPENWSDQAPPKFSTMALLSGFLLGTFILACIAVTAYFIHLIFA